MNIIVFGAGAIGSLYAAKLSVRHAVTVIARKAHVEAIAREGLRVVGRETLVARVAAATAVDRFPPAALVLLTTKVNDNRAAAASMAGAVRDDTVIVCVQNGLGGEEVVRQAIGGRCLVLRAVTQFGAIFREPGVIDYKVAGYTLLEPGVKSAELAAVFSASGLDGRVSSDINVEVWRKLIFNCVINPITSLLGSDVGSIADDRLDPLKRLVVDECRAVAAASGVTFDEDFVRSITDIFGASRNVASMRQDLLKGKRTEIDFMNGAVVAVGQRFGIPCPVNAALTAIVKQLEARAVAE